MMRARYLKYIDTGSKADSQARGATVLAARSAWKLTHTRARSRSDETRPNP